MTPAEKAALNKFAWSTRDYETVDLLISALQRKSDQLQGRYYEQVPQSKKERKAFLNKRRHMIKLIENATASDDIPALLEQVSGLKQQRQQRGDTIEYEY